MHLATMKIFNHSFCTQRLQTTILKSVSRLTMSPCYHASQFLRDTLYLTLSPRSSNCYRTCQVKEQQFYSFIGERTESYRPRSAYILESYPAYSHETDMYLQITKNDRCVVHSGSQSDLPSKFAKKVTQIFNI